MRNKNMTAYIMGIMYFMIALTLFLSGCNTENPSKAEISLTLSETSVTVLQFETVQLKAKVENARETTVVWRSENPTIAVVRDGVVTGISQGTTKITAKAGSLEKTCVVTVLSNEQRPYIKLPQIVQIKHNSTFILHPVVMFNGVQVELQEYTVISFDTSIVTVNALTLNGKAKGEAEITVRSSYLDEELSETLLVKVINDVDLETDVNSISIFLGNPNDRTYKINLVVFENGNIQNKPLLDWKSDNENVAVVGSDGVVTAIGKGSATISVDYKPESGPIVTAQFSLSVKAPLIEEKTDFIFETSKGIIAGLEATLGFASGEVIERLTDISDGVNQNELKYDPVTKKVSGEYQLDFGDVKWHILTNFGEYKADLFVATKAIYTLDDWPSGYGIPVNRTAYQAMTDKDGYFVLGADIDVNPGGEGKTELNSLGNKLEAVSHHFNGTLDGRGHKIKNIYMTTQNMGIVGTLGESGIIKNIAFTDIRTSSPTGYIVTGAIAASAYGTISDVYICFAGKQGFESAQGILINTVQTGAKIFNVILEADSVKSRHKDLDTSYNLAVFATVNKGAEIRNVWSYIGTLYKYDGVTPIDDTGKLLFIKTDSSTEGVTYSGLKRDKSGFIVNMFEDWNDIIWDLPTTDGKLPAFKFK